jgi:uncharacterized phiE125 gp8 family phage protein
MAMVERAAPAAALAELKVFLRIEDEREDALLAGLLRAATETIEAMLGLMLFEREVEERGTVSGGCLLLRAEPARSLVRADLLEHGQVVRELESGEAALVLGAHEVGRLVCAGLDDGAQLLVRLRAGLATDWNMVPEILRLCVVRAAAHFHAHRDSAEDGGLPPAVGRMLAPWRARRLL